MYKNTMGEMGLLMVAICTLSSNISAPIQKNLFLMPRMLGHNVPGDLMQNSSFSDTLVVSKKIV